MKKILGGLFIIVLICGLLLTNSLSAVSAKSIVADIAPGSWSTGTEITIDLAKYPAPYTWYQLVEKGVTITKYGEICHPFRGGQYHWIGDIRHLVNGKWVKVPTTQGWLKGKELPYQVCAQAPDAGTYALFAYYSGPKEYTGTTPATSCAAGLVYVTSSPADYVANAKNVSWSGVAWSTETVTNWNTSLCNLPVTNNDEFPLDVVIRTAKNECINYTIAAGNKEWISGSVADGVCPLELYEALPD